MSSTTSSKETRGEFLSVRPCGRELFELIPKRRIRINLQKASEALSRSGFEIADLDEMVLTAIGAHDLSLFPNGKMLVHPVKTNGEAEELGGGIMGILRGYKGCVVG